MVMPVINPRAADVGENILRQLRARLGDAWNTFDAEYRELIEQCTAEAGVLTVAALVIGPEDRDGQLRLRREQAQIRAQLLNVASAQANAVSAAFWQTVREVAGGLVSIVFAVV